MSALSERLRRAGRSLFRGEEGANAGATDAPAEDFLIHTSWYQGAGAKIQARGIFVGCPLALFELTSRDLMCVALMEGLKSDSSVLEVGCGCLRSGYWFIQFLDCGKYCGVEPNEGMLDAGRELLLGQLEGAKRPCFSTNDRFAFGDFGRRFDFVIAFSIWSHASKDQIETMLDEFRRAANPGAKLLASWYPTRPGSADYLGSSWVGRSHQSDLPGVVCHSTEWLQQAAARRGLEFRRFDRFVTIGQNWAVVTCP